MVLMEGISLGIDIGGTHVKGVIIRDEKVVYKLTRNTEDGREDWQQTVAGVMNELKQKSDKRVAIVGLSAPGIADNDNHTIAYMPPGRLNGLENFDWSGYLNEDVVVLNDAHAALWAESQWGIGKGVRNIVMLTLGTGVGGGLLINGQLYQGFLQRAGHLGHVTIEASSEIPDITGIAGSLEDALGEGTLNKRSLGRFSTTFDLVNAYKTGEPWSTYLWLTTIRKLALGIVSFCNAFSPELFILAGGITKAGDHLLQPLSSFMELYEWRPAGRKTPIKLAQFQDYAGAIGAALYAKTQSAGH